MGFLVALLGDTFDAHDCPHHEIFVPVSTLAADAEDHGHAHGASPMDHGPHGDHASGHAAGSGLAHGHGDGHSGPCMCVGDCHGSAGSPLSPPDAASVVFEAPNRPTPQRAERTAAPASPLPYLIPYSTGPPSTLG